MLTCVENSLKIKFYLSQRGCLIFYSIEKFKARRTKKRKEGEHGGRVVGIDATPVKKRPWKGWSRIDK